MGMKFLLLGAVFGVLGQKYLDMRNHSFREMREYLQLIKYTCPGTTPISFTQIMMTQNEQNMSF